MTNVESMSGGEEAQLVTYLEQGIYPSKGDRVSVLTLEDTAGMLINPRHLDVRAQGITGIAVDYAPGHGGDVWFVLHDKQQNDPHIVGAYSVAEITPTL